MQARGVVELDCDDRGAGLVVPHQQLEGRASPCGIGPDTQGNLQALQ
jgi:hypothetical protein